MLYLINYGNAPYKNRQMFSSYTARRFGKFDKIINYSDRDIKTDSEFCNRNKSILQIQKGNGLWVWKPYILLKTLQFLENDDILMYCDSDTIFIDNIQSFIQLVNTSKNGNLVFETHNKEYQYTKYDLFVSLNLTDDAILLSRQRLSGYHLWKKNDANLAFAQEWLDLGQELENVNDDLSNAGSKYDNEFVAHRHDQSTFSLLSKKYGFEGFRDPSQWGNCEMNSYSNSNYGQLLYTGLGDSRIIWAKTTLLGKCYLSKKFISK